MGSTRVHSQFTLWSVVAGRGGDDDEAVIERDGNGEEGELVTWGGGRGGGAYILGWWWGWGILSQSVVDEGRGRRVESLTADSK